MTMFRAPIDDILAFMHASAGSPESSKSEV